MSDAGHVPRDQLFTWSQLFPALQPGGLYLVLDIETSYWDAPGAELYGRIISAGRRSSGSAVEAFKALVDGVNRDFFQPCWGGGGLGTCPIDSL